VTPDCPLHTAQLTIAGMRFAVGCERPIVDIPPSAAYADFIGEPAAPPDVELPVTLVPRALKGLADFERRFDAEEMWSLFADGSTRYLAHTGWGIDAPLWAAELSPDADSVRVHCGGALLREEEGRAVVSSPIRYPLDQLLLTNLLAAREGVLMHSAGIECGGRLWLLAGRSGAGKSTAAGLLRGQPGLSLLSDDRIVVRRMGAEVRGYGTPWPGEARVAANRQAPLGGILYLEQSTDNRITPLETRTALELLLPVVSVPWYDPALSSEVLTFCGVVVETVPGYRLQFRRDDAAAAMLARFMTEMQSSGT